MRSDLERDLARRALRAPQSAAGATEYLAIVGASRPLGVWLGLDAATTPITALPSAAPTSLTQTTTVAGLCAAQIYLAALRSSVGLAWLVQQGVDADGNPFFGLGNIPATAEVYVRPVLMSVTPSGTAVAYRVWQL